MTSEFGVLPSLDHGLSCDSTQLSGEWSKGLTFMLPDGVYLHWVKSRGFTSHTLDDNALERS